MYDLKWTETLYRVVATTGTPYLGTVTNWPARDSLFHYFNNNQSPGWSALVTDPTTGKAWTSGGGYPTPEDAVVRLADKLEVRPADLALTLIQEQCIGIGEFFAEITEDASEDAPHYRATCVVNALRPPLTVAEGATYAEAKAALETTYDLYKQAMSAVLEAAGAVEKKFLGQRLEGQIVEVVIQGAADAGFRLGDSVWPTRATKTDLLPRR